MFHVPTVGSRSSFSANSAPQSPGSAPGRKPTRNIQPLTPTYYVIARVVQHHFKESEMVLWPICDNCATHFLALRSVIRFDVGSSFVVIR
ncbi:hypothetical protein NL676_033708 [Syzygium grande]|nr:hypothetical protein NL676_033708 [Syzygium grande]